MIEHSEPTTFDPRRYLTQIQGRDYLEVKWRLLWLRMVYPDAVVETDLMRDDGATAVFRARVTLPTGGAATGWKQASFQDFGDYLEKAETGAIGRALAAAGFGTQFCGDHEFGAEEGRVVDSPVQFRPRSRASDEPDRATERQVKAIFAIGRAAHLSDAEINARAQQEFGHPVAGLERRDASTLIDLLKQQTPVAR